MKECIDFANQNPLCYLATTEGDQPHVRGLMFWFADESGFYFQTGAVKEFYKQLQANPRTEVCFYRQEGMAGRMMRVEGKAEFLEDKALKEKVIAERPFLKSLGLSADHPGLIVFRIAHGRAHFWTMETNLQPKQYITF